ncbi:MAG: hypothetical protein IT424_11735 [Pirellulales bacterium]|nr:hypothetical protein [Pirellulales bacterium]
MFNPASRVVSTAAPLHALALALSLAALAAPAAAAVEPVYWRQRIFFIPYQPAEQSQFAPAIDKVQLLVAREAAGQWAVLQEAEPQVRGFSYHAPADGQYDFALRTSDRKGNLFPATIAEPQLRVIVDTLPPSIELNASLDATGRIVLRYEARDLQLRPETLRLEAQADGGPWQPIASGPPDVSQPDRLLGQASWKPPTATGRIQYRAVVLDRAGNQGLGVADSSLVSPLLSSAAGPVLGPAAGGLPSPPPALGPAFPPMTARPATSDAAATTSTPSIFPNSPGPPAQPALDWPTSAPSSAAASTPPVANLLAPPVSTPPPVQNPYTANPFSPHPFAPQAAASPSASSTGSTAAAASAPPAVGSSALAINAPWSPPRTPAQLVGDSAARPPSAANSPSMPAIPWPAAAAPQPSLSPAPSSASSTSGAASPFAPPPLFDGPPPLSGITPLPSNGAAPNASIARSGWSSTTPPPQPGIGDAMRWVNALAFDVDYELQTVGPWGVSKVELWATSDNGQTWVNMGSDPDNRAPMRIAVPAAGVYGFRLVVTGAGGAPPQTPAAGEPPELSIGVDLQGPQAELRTAELGQGNLADHLIIRWTASDEHLDERPAALFFSTEPEGPWTTIATDLENNGQYAWRLPQQLPQQLFLRLEVRDRAGNIAVQQTPAPVALNLPQPTGRLRSVRPVKEPEDPSRFRTASGPSRLPLIQ